MRNKWIYTIVVLALGLFASCSDHIDEPGTDGKSRKVVFRLSVSDAGVGSRAAWSDSYTTSVAEGIENYINPNSLQVVVYEGTTYKGKASNVLSWPATSGDAEYQFVGDLSQLNLVPGNDYQFMVLANCADVSNTTQLSRLPYDISELMNAIPMWGVSKITLTNAELQDLETIDLLRAAAKIEVALDPTEMDGYTLKAVSIKPYNTRGYCAPSGVHSDVDETNALDQEGCYNPHTSLAVESGEYKSLPFTVSQDGKRAFVYVPELDNRHTSSHATTISVTLEKDSETYLYEDAIVFYEYDDATGLPDSSPEKEYNIIRNHHYKFTVIGVSGGLLIKYAVNDWVYDEATHKTELNTYEYPTYHNPMESVAEVNSPKYTPVLWKNNDGSGDFWGYFYFEKPVNKKWTPTFMQSQSNYKIEVWNNEGTQQFYDSDDSSLQSVWDTQDNYFGWYLIKVKAKGGATSGNEVNLGITYAMGDYTSTSYYLLVNGTEENDIRWMDSGLDPRFIKIKLIDEVTTSFQMDDDGNISNEFTTESPTMKTVKSDDVYTEDEAFIASFQLTNTGDYHYWYPTLNGQKSLGDYAVRVYKESELIYSTYVQDGKNDFESLKKLVPVATSSEWYTIKVFPTCDTPSGSPVKLGINYERGNNQPKALNINGTGSSTKWSDSGSDVKYIEITHTNS